MIQSFAMGSIQRKPRVTGGDVWVYRWKEGVTHRSTVIGRCDQMTQKQAQRKSLAIRKEALERQECVTVKALIDKYKAEDIPARHSTASSYLSYLKRIESDFGGMRLDDWLADLQRIERWLRELHTVGPEPRPMAGKSKAHMKAVVHRLAECAMRWGLIEVQRNPVALVELRGISRRGKPLVLVTHDQYDKLLADRILPEHVRVMVQVAMCLGLRASELLGLQWSDVDLLGGTVHIRRSVVGSHEDETKTSESEACLPLHERLVDVLSAWRAYQPVIGDWLFGNPITGRPFHRDTLQQNYIKPAGKRVGIDALGFHAFRHTYRSMLAHLSLPIEVQQKLMRHADIKTTLHYGRSSMLDVTRPANALLVESLGQRVM